ncbi:hypothetical protein MMC22_004122 [Lobaria immixta]|nr:hypothetical protein [Lobaria immixta]
MTFEDGNKKQDDGRNYDYSSDNVCHSTETFNRKQLAKEKKKRHFDTPKAGEVKTINGYQALAYSHIQVAQSTRDDCYLPALSSSGLLVRADHQYLFRLDAEYRRLQSFRANDLPRIYMAKIAQAKIKPASKV